MAIKPGSMRDRGRQVNGELPPAQTRRGVPPRAQPTPRKPKRQPDEQPDGYPDKVLWTLASQFEKRAWQNKVELGSRNVPYIYRALESTVDRVDIRTRRYLNEKSAPVEGTALAVCVVNCFWRFAPWDPSGDVIAQFADPMMFEWCVNKLARLWAHGRVHRRIDEKLKDMPEEAEIMRRPGRDA